jgi:hypothetical protein
VLYARHSAQLSRADHVALWHVLTNMGSDVSENELLMLLQDLSDRRYLTYKESKDRRTGRIDISLVQLTSSGRDLAEETITDPAVHF